MSSVAWNEFNAGNKMAGRGDRQDPSFIPKSLAIHGLFLIGAMPLKLPDPLASSMGRHHGGLVPDQSPEDYLLILRAMPDAVPGVIRLRAALKRFLRSYGLRCIRGA